MRQLQKIFANQLIGRPKREWEFRWMCLGSELLSQVFKSSWSSYKPGDRYANKDLVLSLLVLLGRICHPIPKQHVNSGSRPLTPVCYIRDYHPCWLSQNLNVKVHKDLAFYCLLSQTPKVDCYFPWKYYFVKTQIFFLLCLYTFNIISQKEPQ